MYKTFKEKTRAYVAQQDAEWKKYRIEHFTARAKARTGEALTQEFMRKQMDMGRLTRLDKLSSTWVDKDKFVRGYSWKFNNVKYTVIYNTRDKVFVTIY